MVVFFSSQMCMQKKQTGYTIHIYLVDIVHRGKSVKLQVHGVKHMNDLNGFTHGADIGKGHYITEQYGAFFEFSCETHTHEDAKQPHQISPNKLSSVYIFLLSINLLLLFCPLSAGWLHA